MKIATWNVNSVRVRLAHLLRWLEMECPDVVCLQELKARDEDFPHEQIAEAGYRAEVLGQKTFNGVALLCRGEFEETRRNLFHLDAYHPLNAQSRLIWAKTSGVWVGCGYFPNGQTVTSDKYVFKLAWFDALADLLAAEFDPASDIALCGDFNVTPEPDDLYDPEAFAGDVPYSEPELDALEKIRNWGLTDCFRLHHPAGKAYSWWDYRQGMYRRGLGLRLDHIWATKSLAQRCATCEIDPSPRGWEKPSDHAPVWAEFKD